MSIPEQFTSHQKKIDQILNRIAGIPDRKTGIAIENSGIAQPGDLFFFITHYDVDPLLQKTRSIRECIDNKRERIAKRFCGFSPEDSDNWHVAIFCWSKKRKHHNRMNLWMLHSHPPACSGMGGVHLRHFSPSIFFNNVPAERTRLEILEIQGISAEDRKQIVNYALGKQGANFDHLVRRHSLLTLIFGIPNFLYDQKSYSCQHLVVESYASSGVSFDHPFRSYPFYNIGRYLGHPLGHSKDRINLKYPYLMDHHIYRDPRFRLKASLYTDSATGELKLETENLKKYSWNLDLRKKYLPECDR